MQIPKNSIALLASFGKITLQIPDMPLGDVKYEEAPDDWFLYLKRSDGKFVPTSTPESAFLFLSEKGWIQNKESIRDAFEKSDVKEGDWEEFEEHAQEFFKRIKENGRIL